MFAHPNKKIFVHADIIFHLEFLPPFLLFSTKWVLILVYWKKSDACYLQKERKFLMFKHMYVDEILLIIFIRLLSWWLLPFRCILLVNLLAVIVHWVWIWYQSAICLCFPCLSAVRLAYFWPQACPSFLLLFYSPLQGLDFCSLFFLPLSSASPSPAYLLAIKHFISPVKWLKQVRWHKYNTTLHN